MKGTDRIIATVLLVQNALVNARATFMNPDHGKGKPEKFGKLPPMGFNSWNAFRCDISEEKFLTAADKILEFGLEGLGYEYVNIDGELVPCCLFC